MASASVQRRLEALECPFLKEVDMEDMESLQRLICWLEDVHIRAWTEAERTSLRRGGGDFLAQMGPYLRAAGYGEAGDVRDVRELAGAAVWLVRRAVGLCYGDQWEALGEPVDLWEGRSVAVVAGAGTDEEVARRADELAETLGMREAAADAPVGERLAAAARVLRAAAEGGEGPEGRERGAEGEGRWVRELDELSGGFEEEDEVVERVGKVLRLLYVKELKELQTGINEVITDMQAVTANPKTDAKLGKVGR